MPKAPAKPCRIISCPNVDCTIPAHQRRPFASARKSTTLYHTKAWRIRRAEHLAREPYCRTCRTQGRRTPAVVADHIEPHRGDPEAFFRGALQSLCWKHSNVKTAQEIGARAPSRRRAAEAHPGANR